MICLIFIFLWSSCSYVRFLVLLLFSVSLLFSKTGNDPKRGFKTGLKQISIRTAPSTNLDNVEVPPCGARNHEKNWESWSPASWSEQLHSKKFRFSEGTKQLSKKWKPFLVLNAFEAGAYYIWNHFHWCLIWLGGSLWCSTFYCSDRFQTVSDHPVVGF